MVRPIDGNDFMRRLTLDTSKGHYGEFMDGSEVAFTSREIATFVEQMPTLTPPNEPLTLDELREMDVGPIYVTTKNYGDGWCILNWHGVNKSYTYFSRTGTSEGMTATPLSAKTYGDLWLAYRRPPEGEDV